ncbi:MAG: bifunctional purine biosynthesis protein PurH [Oligoflexia bacterium]|nr:MAG: bifunctional purine biosynthesis protein PurH [Oligoflexia bacterium]
MFKNALVSVSDKTGLVDFLRLYAQKGMRILSTGGTAQHLKENGFQVVDVSEQTGFPEVMGGRVKTLHPNIHMCLLSRPDHPEDFELLKKQSLEPIDLLVCNLYPFEQAVLKNSSYEELIENIDIGGPSLLRGAAKNHQQVTVVCDPADYKWISERESLELKDRLRLAAKVFAHVSSYDSLIAQELGAGWGQKLSLGGEKVFDLRYGENPHQGASWYRLPGQKMGLETAEILQGKPLSYNNILDLDAASCLVRELSDFACVAVKHNNPCGVAQDKTVLGAVQKSIGADPVSVFGGILAINGKVDAASAEVMSKIFLECVIAPDYEPKALEIFSQKKNLRILKWAQMNKAQKSFEVKTVTGGWLIQHADQYGSETAEWKFLGEKPDEKVIKNLVFAEKVCSALKSNAIAIIQNEQTVGLGMGQVNRVDAVQHAVDRMKAHHAIVEDAVLASDAFFPFPDSIEKAHQAGIKWILQPGGSVSDEQVFARARELGINMVITGMRHFRH